MTFPEGTGGVLSGLAGMARDSVLGLLRGPSLAPIWEAFSGAAILSDLRDMGFEIRTQTFYDIRRDILGLNKWQEQIKGLDNNTLLPRAWMVERSDIDFSNQAQYRFDVTYIDEETGETIKSVRAISSDYHYTKRELYDSFASLFGEGMQEYGLELQTFDLKSVWIQLDARLIR